MLKVYQRDYLDSFIEIGTNPVVTQHNIVTYPEKIKALYIQRDEKDSQSYSNISVNFQEEVSQLMKLALGIDEKQTLISLTNCKALGPSSVILIGKEKMLVETVDYIGKTIQVRRGYEGTPQESSSAGMTITTLPEGFSLRKEKNGKIDNLSFNEKMNFFLNPVTLATSVEIGSLILPIEEDSYPFEKGAKLFLENEELTLESVERKETGLYLLLETETQKKHKKNSVIYNDTINDNEKHLFFYSAKVPKGLGLGFRNDTKLHLKAKGMDELIIPLAMNIREAIVGTIGDSITAGHDGFRAENHKGTYCQGGHSYDDDNTSEDVTSQYQYWLSYRLGRNYKVYNYGTGEEVGYQVKNRFSEILALEPDYAIIQCGTNDLSLFDGAKLVSGLNKNSSMIDWMETKKEIVLNKNGKIEKYFGLIPAIQEMVSLCKKSNIRPILGNLLPRNFNSLAANDLKNAMRDFNEWLFDYCKKDDEIYFIDFFNGQYDGQYLRKNPSKEDDFDMNDFLANGVKIENGEIVKPGDGIHLNAQGYRVMGYCFGIDIMFDAASEGFELYNSITDLKALPSTFDNLSNLMQYPATYKHMQQGQPKTITRYLLNKGTKNSMYCIYIDNKDNLDVHFINGEGKEVDFLRGQCRSGEFVKIVLKVLPKKASGTSLKIKVIGKPIENI